MTTKNPSRGPRRTLKHQRTPAQNQGDPRDEPQLPLLAPGVELDAYLACALTGLEGAQRELMCHVSDTVSLVCREQGIDLYEPRKKTDPNYHPNIPDREVFRLDKERVANSDLVIHLCQFPSTGSGQELEIAHSALVPIILLVSPESKVVSRMITGIPSLSFQVRYDEPEDLRLRLRERLIEIRPLLEERRLAFSDYDVNIVGSRIRQLRENGGLSVEVVAERVGIAPEALEGLESSTDRTANESLLHLRRIAAILGTTVSELVDPDAAASTARLLESAIDGRLAARFGVDSKDRVTLLRAAAEHILASLAGDES